jgi:hypothetical protein
MQHFLEIRNLHVLNIRDQMLIRAKKVNANGRHRNNHTLQQRAFDAQEELPGLPPVAARLVMAYQPDAAFSEVERVTVRRPLGRWVSQIVDAELDRRVLSQRFGQPLPAALDCRQMTSASISSPA